MHIPRQYLPARTTPEQEQLRDELRRTVYWRRLVQARLDLLIAGLLYSAPCPAQLSAGHGQGIDPVRNDPARIDAARTDPSPPGPTGPDMSSTADLGFAAPAGMDLGYLLDGSMMAVTDRDRDTGARLDRLRAASRRLTEHEHVVRAQLDELRAPANR